MPPVAAHDPNLDDDMEDQNSFNAAFDVRRLHAAARAKAVAAGELSPGGSIPQPRPAVPGTMRYQGRQERDDSMSIEHRDRMAHDRKVLNS